ncbi:hypothetical protein SLEP1_g58893 [Rubroshorea leprosula]|uniref:Uncharacterized protein n=1 Tax=Rubroshorea leprosula TaxID=152421 RepID=A0AAV5MT78_9ROSI|nr:hypothetical protein SLEP1_g58893 [Rubroshorea leprosula]
MLICQRNCRRSWLQTTFSNRSSSPAPTTPVSEQQDEREYSQIYQPATEVRCTRSSNDSAKL